LRGVTKDFKGGCLSLNRLLRNRRGTAEIVGSVMFLVILFFFFTNVYLWHDQATREMDNVVLDRVNSPVSIVDSTSPPDLLKLQVTNNGGTGFLLSRLWIITDDNHNYADFENANVTARWLAGGASMNITLLGEDRFAADGSYLVGAPTADGIGVYYYHNPSVEVTFKILTDLGNTAAHKCIP
jgi:archaellum component FlaF (FlaF/FlaG flagellin family)